MLRERHGKAASRWICGCFIMKAPTTSEASGIEVSQNFSLAFKLSGLETVWGAGRYAVCQQCSASCSTWLFTTIITFVTEPIWPASWSQPRLRSRRAQWQQCSNSWREVPAVRTIPLCTRLLWSPQGQVASISFILVYECVLNGHFILMYIYFLINFLPSTKFSSSLRFLFWFESVFQLNVWVM